jgi:hypothetical protein
MTSIAARGAVRDHRGVRWLMLGMLVACGTSESKSKPPEPEPTPAAPKPPDDMDEKMRHCPLALDGASSTFREIEGGVRFVVKAPAAAIAEVRRRAHHVVEFAARRHAKGTHGAFDGKGGGRMKNCPVVTDDVTITVTETAEGAQLDVTTTPDGVASLRAESHKRIAGFPFVGASIVVEDRRE